MTALLIWLALQPLAIPAGMWIKHCSETRA